METRENVIESELHSSNGCGDAATTTAQVAPQQQPPSQSPSFSSPPRIDNGGAAAPPDEDVPPPIGYPSPLNGDPVLLSSGDPQRSSPDHHHDESTGSGVTSGADSNESSTNLMDDSMEIGGSGDKDPPDEDAEPEDEEVAAVAAETATPAATKRFKCSHCSKSYVREFQLNTHVRKYHPEKPKPPDATTGTSPPAKASNSWTQADMDEALEALKTEKMALVKAGQQYGIPASTLWQRATRLGIMIPKNGTRSSSKDGVADAVQLLKTGQISVNKASKVFGIPPSTLYKIAKREGIQLSSPFNSATTSWTQENLQLAMDAIRTGQMSVHMASVEYKIPPGTLYGRCKREGLELSRNNPVQWSPRDLKNALEAVKTGQMSINQASEHYKISYSSLYKRVKPHFVHNNNNNNSNSSSNHNLPKMGNELGETDPQQQAGVGLSGMVGGGVGVIVPPPGGVNPGVGLDVVPMHHHHPMDYEAHRPLPHMTTLPHHLHHHPQAQQTAPPVQHHHQMQYGNSPQHQAQQQQQHYGQQQHPQQPQSTMHHYPNAIGQQQQHIGHGAGQQGQMHLGQQQHSLMRHGPVQQGQMHLGQQQHSLMRHHHPQLHHQQIDPMNEPPSHPQLQQQHHQLHQAHNGQMQQDDRTGGYHSHDVDKHGLTSSSGIGLNGLMGISMGFLDFAPEPPAPVAVPVTEHYSSAASPYSSVITKDSSGGSAAPPVARHPGNNGHYNGGGIQQAAPSDSNIGNGGGAGGVSGSHNGSSIGVAHNRNSNNGYATLRPLDVDQNNYYQQQHSVIHSPSSSQQQQQHHHLNQQAHHQLHQGHPQHHHSHPQSQGMHHQGMQVQRHGMVPLNEDKLMHKDIGMGALLDPHAATAEHEDKVIVTTINDL